MISHQCPQLMAGISQCLKEGWDVATAEVEAQYSGLRKGLCDCSCEGGRVVLFEGNISHLRTWQNAHAVSFVEVLRAQSQASCSCCVTPTQVLKP